MDNKTQAFSSRNGGGETATLSEMPFEGISTKKVTKQPKEATETEAEEVAGYTRLKPGEADNEVSSPAKETEADEAGAAAETGSEGTEAIAGKTETAPLDAIYASYPELLKESSQVSEVVIKEDNRVRINSTTSYPWRSICALRITAQNGTHWIGTGWLVSPRTVITAGHCVYMHDQGGWAKSIEVIPGLNGLQKPYQSGISTNFRSVTGWTQNKNRENDYGAIILPANYRPGDANGYFGYAVKDDAFLKSAILNLSGYPGDLPKPPSTDPKGSQQFFMALGAKFVAPRVIVYDIDTFGGQSGAPVWVKIGENRYCVGIHTNGDTSGNSATRIVQAVFDNIKSWKALGM